MPMPVIEGLRVKNQKVGEVVIYITGQPWGNRIKFVIADIAVRKPRARKFRSVTEQVKESYRYRCLETEGERRSFLAEEYLRYVTEAQVEEALLCAWEMCRPQIA